MISIVFAVPYPEMRQTVLDVFESHPRHRELSQTIRVIQAERVTIDDLKGSIIVARGLTYRRIRSQFPNLPCVEVVVHTADILAALRRCGRTYQPKRIALVGHFPYLPPTEAFEPLLGCRVVYYPEDSVRTMRQQIARALEEGADALAGGYSLCLWAESNGQPATIVTSSRDAIRAALDDALRTYDILQQNEIAKIALENTREAVLYADHAGLVSYCNPAARHLLEGLGLPSAQDIPLGQALPFLVPVLDGSDGRPPSFDDALFDFRGTSLAASATPVFIGDAPAGAVVTVTTVESIRRLEYTIRRRLSEKGLRARYTFDDIICGTEMAEVVAKAKKCALVSSNILIVGETGTGKELFAQSIHNHSGRKHGPFVAINCAALPEHLIESELFGYSEGAFTGARRGGKLGLIETAHGGTLFLDEVSELPLAVQGKLLRVLQEREVRRVADDKLITVDVRLIAASNIPLPEYVRAGRFRRDLMYRLDILSLFIPPLRERRRDILPLFWHHMRGYNQKLGGTVTSLSPEAERVLLDHPFEGNVRELRNIAERLCVLSAGGRIHEAEMRDSLCHGSCGRLPVEPPVPADAPVPTPEAVRLRDALRECDGNRTRAARRLGMDRSTLWRKMRRYGIR